MDRMRVGIVGCGAISGFYLKAAKNHPNLDMAACADVVPEAAQRRAQEFGVPKVCTVDELLADPAIDCVLNLTIPRAHAEVAMRAVQAGKHTYSEKPLGINRKEGRQLIDAAVARGVRVGCAPDTFLGAGHQTARKLLDDGAIGRPVAFTAFMLCRGHETWHPNPEFYYEPGGGPMFDMGPYYLTALINLFGPINRVTGFASIAIPERTITHKNPDGSPGRLFNKKINVTTPDHVAGTVEFTNGVVGTIMTSFAVAHSNYDHKTPITIFGTEGTILAPDPNGFDGAVKLAKRGKPEFEEVPHTHPVGYARSVGLADLAHAVEHNRPQRVSGSLAMAVLDAMAGFLDASESGQAVEITEKIDRPAPLPAGEPFGAF